MRTFLVAVLMLSLSFLAHAQNPDHRSAAGCGPVGVDFDVKTTKDVAPEKPEVGKALVYVIETEKKDSGLAFVVATTRVGLDGNWVGANHGNTYFAISVEPGEHHLCADWQSGQFSNVGSALTLNAEAGKTYYVETNPDERRHREPALKLKLIDPAEGELLISYSQRSTAHRRRGKWKRM